MAFLTTIEQQVISVHALATSKTCTYAYLIISSMLVHVRQPAFMQKAAVLWITY